MRLLILTPVYPTVSSPTEGIFNEQHVRALAARGIDCTVIVCKPWLPDWLARRWHKYRSLAGLGNSQVRDGVNVIFARYFHVPGYRAVWLTIAACAHSITDSIEKNVRNIQFDLVHAHSVFPVGLAAPQVAQSLHIPFLVTLHIEDSPALYSSKSGHTLYEQMFGQASAIVAVGSPLERFAKQLMPANVTTPVTIIPNGIDWDDIERLSGTVLPHETWGHIVSVANLWKSKGIDYNLRALAELDRRGIRRWQYTIVGDGPERTFLESLARELGVADRVQFAGALPHNEAIQVIAQADIFALPSWKESFGVVYLEAMACGKPVIGCRGQGAEDIFEHEETGLLVNPHDIDSLADALARLLQNPNEARQLGARARKRAKDFTWQRNAQQYASLYDSISAMTLRDTA
jgi:glycosyltransferase involved in cell wall biosynthesis